MNIFTAVFMFVGIFTAFIAAAVLRGWVLSVLWGWFVVPIFYLSPLSTAQAMAISLVVSLMTHQYVPSKDGEKWEPVVMVMLYPLAALLIGWIVKAWI